MAVPFDHIALTYDAVLTPNAIGQIQRRHVWNYLEKVIHKLDGLEMLELNWGADEDALMFSDKGYNIIATDVSVETLKVTQQKAQQFSMPHKISSQYIDVDCFNECLFDRKYDLIFSNFGGLNCINPESLKKLIAKIPSLLNPNGRFVSVIMPRFCLFESIYYGLRLQFKNAFRRWTSGEVITETQGTVLKTWYYSPSIIKRWAAEHFNVMETKPIGLALPPSSLDTFFLRRKRLLMRLNKLEKRLFNHSLYPGMADHFLIDLKLKPEARY